MLRLSDKHAKGKKPVIRTALMLIAASCPITHRAAATEGIPQKQIPTDAIIGILLLCAYGLSRFGEKHDAHVARLSLALATSTSRRLSYAEQ